MNMHRAEPPVPSFPGGDASMKNQVVRLAKGGVGMLQMHESHVFRIRSLRTPRRVPHDID